MNIPTRHGTEHGRSPHPPQIWPASLASFYSKLYQRKFKFASVVGTLMITGKIAKFYYCVFENVLEKHCSTKTFGNDFFRQMNF